MTFEEALKAKQRKIRLFEKNKIIFQIWKI